LTAEQVWLVAVMNETERMNRQIKLKDGRMLGYAEYGAAGGKPAFCFHGFPGSRIDGLIFDPDDLAAERGARLIVADRPELVTLLIESLREAFRSGIGGVNHEAGLYARPWGFQLQDIDAKLHLWHGEQDNNVPVSVGRYVAWALPNCSATFLEDEGHFSILRDRVPEILNVLLA